VFEPCDAAFTACVPALPTSVTGHPAFAVGAVTGVAKRKKTIALAHAVRVIIFGIFCTRVNMIVVMFSW
jgi:hypothetical protein